MFVMAAGAAMMLMVTGCGDGRKVPDNSLAFDDVVYVEDEYPVTWELTEGDTLDIPVIGVSDFVIKDSLLIVSNNDNAGRVTVLSLDGKTVLGKFLRKGRGPGEIVSFNGVSMTQFSHRDGHLTACWTDYAGTLVEWDITASLRDGLSEVATRDLELDGSLWLLEALPIGDRGYLIAVAGEDKNTIKRFVLSREGKTEVTPPLERPNRVEVRSTAQGSGMVAGSGNMVTFSVPGFNSISGDYAYSPERGLVVEAERTRNSLSIFSIDGDYARTVCIYGNSIDDVSDVDVGNDRERLTLRPKAFPGFISALHWLREPEVELYVRLYGYDGEPLAEIPLPKGGIFYDFDISGGCLYVLVSGQELLIRYDVSGLLQEIGQ